MMLSQICKFYKIAEKLEVTHTCIDQKQIHTKLVGFLLHVSREADIVAPISSVVLSNVSRWSYKIVNSNSLPAP